jgi:CRP-like cAMP-binding protein
MDYNVLSTSPLFRGLNIDEIQSALGSVYVRFRNYKSGSLIYNNNDIVTSLSIVLGGSVKGEMTDYAGKVIKIEDIMAAGAIAPAFIFGKNNRFPVSVTAVQDTRLMIIDKKDFLKLLSQNPTILVNFLDMISNRSQFLSDKIKFLNFKTIKSKLAQYILELAGNKPDIRLDRTQHDLANYFGVARPSVARALGDLEEQGIIETSGKNIKILKRQILAELTND